MPVRAGNFRPRSNGLCFRLTEKTSVRSLVVSSQFKVPIQVWWAFMWACGGECRMVLGAGVKSWGLGKVEV